MDLQSVKNMLSIKNTQHDDYLIEMLPILIDFAKDKCNNLFLVDGEEVIPSGVKLFIKNAMEFNMKESGLKGRTMGEVSYTYETDFPPSVMKYLSPYKKVRFR
jgi:hypothetical protein